MISSQEKLRLVLLKLLNTNELRFFAYLIYNIDLSIIHNKEWNYNYDRTNLSVERQIDLDLKLEELTTELSFDVESGRILIQFYETCLEKYTMPELLYMLVHNILHILNKHNVRKFGLNESVFDLAADHVINQILLKDLHAKNLKTIASPDSVTTIPWLLTKNLTTEEVYTSLMNSIEKNKNNSNQQAVAISTGDASLNSLQPDSSGGGNMNSPQNKPDNNENKNKDKPQDKNNGDQESNSETSNQQNDEPDDSENGNDKNNQSNQPPNSNKEDQEQPQKEESDKSKGQNDDNQPDQTNDGQESGEVKFREQEKKINADIIEINGKTTIRIQDINKIVNSNDNAEMLNKIEEMRNSAALLLEQDNITKGFTSGNLLEYLKLITKIEVPWDVLLEKAILVNTTTSPDIRSWMNPMKRLRAHNIILPGPGIDKKLETVVIVIDSSGSISSENLEKFAGICCSALSRFDKVWLLKHDVKVYCDEIIQGNELTQEKILTEFKGRGGTSHSEVYKRIEKCFMESRLKLGLILFLTDFESDIEQLWSKFNWTKNIPVVHILTKENKIPKHIDDNPIIIKKLENA